MSKDRIEEIIKERIQESLEEKTIFTNETVFQDINGWDSLTAMIFIDKIKDEFLYEISVEDLNELSVYSLTELISENGISDK